MDDISASLEDYLEMIFILHRKGGEVRVTDIASSLKVSKQRQPRGRRAQRGWAAGA
mgnify:CR=1 FL=1